MGNNSNDKFEDTLKDILTPNDPNVTSPEAHQPPSDKSDSQTVQDVNKPLYSKIPRWVETLIRLLAALCALAMLILFGMQVANR